MKSQSVIQAGVQMLQDSHKMCLLQQIHVWCRKSVVDQQNYNQMNIYSYIAHMKNIAIILLSMVLTFSTSAGFASSVSNTKEAKQTIVHDMDVQTPIMMNEVTNDFTMLSVQSDIVYLNLSIDNTGSVVDVNVESGLTNDESFNGITFDYPDATRIDKINSNYTYIGNHVKKWVM